MWLNDKLTEKVCERINNYLAERLVNWLSSQLLTESSETDWVRTNWVNTLEVKSD